MNEDGRALRRVREQQVRLTGEEAFGIHGAGRDPAQRLAVLIDDRIAVVRHAHARLVEAEAHNHALALLLAGHVGLRGR